MTDGSDAPGTDDSDPESKGTGQDNPEPAEAEDDPTVEELQAEIDELRDRTIHHSQVERSLRRYVRRRQRRATGWGPYIVLLYGTIMTLGAFYYLAGGWAILAMIVIWLSTLGLFTLMVAINLGLSVLGIPRRLLERVRK